MTFRSCFWLSHLFAECPRISEKDEKMSRFLVRIEATSLFKWWSRKNIVKLNSHRVRIDDARDFPLIIWAGTCTLYWMKYSVFRFSCSWLVKAIGRFFKDNAKSKENTKAWGQEILFAAYSLDNQSEKTWKPAMALCPTWRGYQHARTRFVCL